MTEWIQPPRLRTLEDPDEERHATWLELFFDLVFVVAVSQIANRLSADHSAAGFARFAALFVPATWAWTGFTFYANRFDTDDVIYRATKCVAMLAIAAFAINVHHATTAHGSVGFALSYVAVRAVLLALYVRARRHVVGVARRVATIYLVGFGVGGSLWLASVAVPTPWRFWMWGIGLALDLSLPPLAWGVLQGARLNISHITERFGLFFIIVLGEAVLAVVAGTSGISFGVQTALVATGGFAAATCLWWIYFDFADTSVIGRGILGLIFMYGHFLLLGGVAAFGVGVKLAIKQAGLDGLDAGARWALCGGVAAYLLALSAFHISAEWTTLRDRVLAARLLLAAGLMALAAAGGGLDPLVIIGLLAAGLIAQLVLEAVSFPEGAASVWQPG